MSFCFMLALSFSEFLEQHGVSSVHCTYIFQLLTFCCTEDAMVQQSVYLAQQFQA